jgi:hypothetical protein
MSHIIKIPLGEVPEGAHLVRHVDVVLSPPQSARLHQLFDALVADGAKLKNGRALRNPQDAIRFILEAETVLEKPELMT